MKKRNVLALPFVLTAAIAGADKAPPPKKKLPKAPAGAHVQKNADGTCWYHDMPSCPPNVHCNPGPPQEVECPPDKPADKK